MILCVTEKMGDYFTGYTAIGCSQRTVYQGGGVSYRTLDNFQVVWFCKYDTVCLIKKIPYNFVVNGLRENNCIR